MIKKIFFLFISISSFGQIVKPEGGITLIDSVAKEAPTKFDTMSYAEEYKRDNWNFFWGVRGGVGRGKFTINEATIDQLSATGLPVLDNSGKIVKNQFVNNETFGTGYCGGVFFRFVRGSFYLQPEINYTVKAGKFDLLKTDGSLYKRVNGQVSSVDVPLLLGVRSRNSRVFFGPTFNFAYKMNNAMKDALSEFVAVEKLNHKFFNRPIMNFNVGVGFEFGSFFFDVRYEKAIKSYSIQNLGPSSSPKVFNLFADGFHLGIGYIHK